MNGPNPLILGLLVVYFVIGACIVLCDRWRDYCEHGIGWPLFFPDGYYGCPLYSRILWSVFAYYPVMVFCTPITCAWERVFGPIRPVIG